VCDADGAGGVSGFLGCAGGRPGAGGGFLDSARGRQSRSRTRRSGLSRRTAACTGNLLAAGQDAGDVGEAAAVGDLHLVQLRPVFFQRAGSLKFRGFGIAGAGATNVAGYQRTSAQPPPRASP
jgi:hypothetical protein